MDRVQSSGVSYAQSAGIEGALGYRVQGSEEL